MKSLRNASLHRALAIIFLVSSTMLVMCAITGCAGTFLADASPVIEAVLAAISSVSGILSILVPGASQVFSILSAVTGEVQEIQTLIEQYKTTPNETTLQKIEAGIQLAITNIQPLLAPVGVPAAVATKIAAIGQLILGQLEAWLSLFPSLSSTPVTTTAAAAPAVTAHVIVSIKKPMSAKNFSKAVNAILDTPTGDAKTDAAFAHATRLAV